MLPGLGMSLVTTFHLPPCAPTPQPSAHASHWLSSREPGKLAEAAHSGQPPRTESCREKGGERI